MARDAEIERFTFTLHVSHPTFAPEEIASRVGQVPARSVKAGSRPTTTDGVPLPNGKPRKLNYCAFKPIAGPADGFAEALKSATSDLTARGKEFSAITASGGFAYFYVGYFLASNVSNGFTISPDLSASLAALGLSVSFALYNHDD